MFFILVFFPFVPAIIYSQVLWVWGIKNISIHSLEKRENLARQIRGNFCFFFKTSPNDKVLGAAQFTGCCLINIGFESFFLLFLFLAVTCKQSAVTTKDVKSKLEVVIKMDRLRVRITSCVFAAKNL